MTRKQFLALKPGDLVFGELFLAPAFGLIIQPFDGETAIMIVTNPTDWFYDH